MKKVLLIFLLIPISAFADEVFMSNITNGCSSGLNSDTFFLPKFTPNQYQCNSGYYLPANTDHCVVCPAYYDCNGGTFTFDEIHDQGNTFKTQVSGNISNGCRIDFLSAGANGANIRAKYIPNTHTCSAGYYLPAGVDECTQCPVNNYCLGGTYTYNETTTQGISGQCATGYSSPAGASSCTANTITVRWDDGNGGAYTTTCTYGGALTTPTTEPVAPRGYHFTGWSFN